LSNNNDYIFIFFSDFISEAAPINSIMNFTIIPAWGGRE
jgi:hypothetical protein